MPFVALDAFPTSQSDFKDKLNGTVGHCKLGTRYEEEADEDKKCNKESKKAYWYKANFASDVPTEEAAPDFPESLSEQRDKVALTSTNEFNYIDVSAFQWCPYKTYESNFNEEGEKHWLWLTSTLDGGMNFGFSQDGTFGFAEKGKEVTPTGDGYNKFKFTIPQKTGEVVLSGADDISVVAAQTVLVEDTVGEWGKQSCPNYKDGGKYDIIVGIIGNKESGESEKFSLWGAAAYLLPTSRDRLKPSTCSDFSVTNWRDKPDECPICEYELLLFWPTFFQVLDDQQAASNRYQTKLNKLRYDSHSAKVEEKHLNDSVYPFKASSIPSLQDLDSVFDPYSFKENFAEHGKDISEQYWATYGEGGSNYQEGGFNTSGEDLGNGVAVIPLKFDPSDPISLTSQSKFNINGKGGDGADMWNPGRYLDDPEGDRDGNGDEYLHTNDGHSYDIGPNTVPWSWFKY